MRIILTITLFGTLLGSALAAELRIQGLSTLSESEVLGIIGERLVSIKSRPATMPPSFLSAFSRQTDSPMPKSFGHSKANTLLCLA